MPRCNYAWKIVRCSNDPHSCCMLTCASVLYADLRRHVSTPCPITRPSTGQNHPRQAFWWGRPFLQAYLHTGNASYLAVANRSAYWYATALRLDGGLTRWTGDDFNGASYHTCTSASLTGAILMYVRALTASRTNQSP